MNIPSSGHQGSHAKTAQNFHAPAGQAMQQSMGAVTGKSGKKKKKKKRKKKKQIPQQVVAAAAEGYNNDQLQKRPP